MRGEPVLRAVVVFRVTRCCPLPFARPASQPARVPAPLDDCVFEDGDMIGRIYEVHAARSPDRLGSGQSPR